MASTNIISINPGLEQTGCSSLGDAMLFRQVASGAYQQPQANDAQLAEFIFPCRDRGLGTSLLTLAARLMILTLSAFAIASNFSTLPLWITICTGIAALQIASGVLFRPGCLLFFIASLTAGIEFLSFLWGAMALSSLIIFITGPGWFSADYFTGRKVQRNLRLRDARRRMSYAAYRYAN